MIRSRCSPRIIHQYESSIKRWHLIPSSHNYTTQRQNVVKPTKSLYIDTTPPTQTHLQAATLFFRTHQPSKSWTATEWRKNQPHNAGDGNLTPEVTFLGRSNSGKSSLLNALLLNPALCRVGPKPGKTTTMHAWSLSPMNSTSNPGRRGVPIDISPSLNVLDMPGYGHGSHGEWGADIMKYLTSRRQLRRAFVLVNPAHGLKKGDLQMLELLRAHGVSHQMIACKCDHNGVGPLDAALQGLKIQLERQFGKGGPQLLTIGDILAVGGLGDGKANQNVKSGQMKGVEDVRWAVLRAAGLEEYALTMFENGGVLPKVSTSSEKTVSEPVPNNEVETMTTAEPFQPEVVPAVVENVGIGIDQFLAMADVPDEKSIARTSLSPRQQRMRRRTVAR